MTNISKTSERLPSLADYLDDIPMNPSDRAVAKAHMRNAEQIADFICAAEARLLSAIAKIKTGGGVLAQRVASAFKKPAHD